MTIAQFNEEDAHRAWAAKVRRGRDEAVAALAASRASEAAALGELHDLKTNQTHILLAGRIDRLRASEAALAADRDYWHHQYDLSRGIAVEYQRKIVTLQSRVAELVTALLEPLPDDVPSMGGFSCRLCGWDVDPSMSDTHEPACVLYRAALDGAAAQTEGQHED